MQPTKNIIDCYNKTANNYARDFFDELSHKPLDRTLLKTFVEENRDKGKLIDLGCGPGQTTFFLFKCGQKDILGVDISPKMVTIAQKLNPKLRFETADMLNLKYEGGVFGSAIAFYSIVNFNYDQVKIAFDEIYRVLIAGGQFLLSFHIGDQLVHLDNFLDHEVNIDFYFFETHKIVDLLVETGFQVIDIIEREPYKDFEYPSKRAYIGVVKSNR